MPETIAFLATAASLAGGTSVAASTVLYYGTTIAIYSAVTIGSQYLTGLLNKPKGLSPSDVKTNIREPIAWRLHSVGTVRIGGPILLYESKDASLFRIFAPGSGEIDAILQHIIDDKVVTVAGDGDVVGNDNARLFWRMGEDDQEAYSQLLSELPEIWTEDHQGNGFPHVLMIMNQGEIANISENWPNGINTRYSQVQQSARVYDPRTDTTAFSENAALNTRYFMTSPYGMGLEESFFDNAVDYWTTAADISDGDVPLAAGGTEKRWTISNTWSLSERPSDVLDRFLQAFDGEIFATPDLGIGVRAGGWIEPTVTLDETAITSVSSIRKGGDALSRINTVKATFTSRTHRFEEVEADAWIDDEAVAEDGEVSDDLTLFPVHSHGQCRRLMKIHHRRKNPDWQMTVTTNLKGLAVLGERFINIRLSLPTVDTSFEITSVPAYIVDPETNALLGLQFEVSAMTAEAWEWDAETEEGRTPVVPEDYDYEPPPPSEPAGFLVEAFTKTVGGIALPYLRISADDPGVDRRTEFQVSTNDGASWTTLAHDADVDEAEFGPIEDGNVPLCRAQVVTTGGQASGWNEPWIVAAGDVFGPELNEGGDFSIGWGPAAGWGIASGVATHTPGSTTTLVKSFSLTSGEIYRIALNVSPYVAGAIRPRLIGGGTLGGTLISSGGEHVDLLTAIANHTAIDILPNSAADLSIDSFSVRQQMS